MLIRLPELFSPSAIASAAELDYWAPLLEKQYRLVRGVLVGALGLYALSVVPALSGAGPVLTWAAQTWPAQFASLYHYVEQPSAWCENVASIVIAAAFALTCWRELHGLRSVLGSLAPLELSTALKNEMARTEATSVSAAAYLNRVRSVRTLRVGDWRIAWLLR